MIISSSLRTPLVLLLLGFALSCTNEKPGQAGYGNPVIPGEIPDPSIIRVGDTYYATGTSFDFAPNYPLYQSRDLVNREQVGGLFLDPPGFFTMTVLFLFTTPVRERKTGSPALVWPVQRISARASGIMECWWNGGKRPSMLLYLRTMMENSILPGRHTG